MDIVFLLFFLSSFKKGGILWICIFHDGEGGKRCEVFFLDGGGGIWGILDVGCGLCVGGGAGRAAGSAYVG